MREIKRVREIPVYEHQYGTLYDDEVAGPDGNRGRYARWRPRFPGICVVPVREGRVGVIKQYRYCIEQPSYEVPRGLVEPGEAVEDGAVREMREEMGFEARSCRPIGRIYADTGLIGRHIDVFVCEAGDRVDTDRDRLESITDICWLTRDELHEWIGSGRIECGITLAAIARAQALQLF